MSSSIVKGFFGAGPLATVKESLEAEPALRLAVESAVAITGLPLVISEARHEADDRHADAFSFLDYRRDRPAP